MEGRGEGGLPQWEKKARGGGLQKCEDAMNELSRIQRLLGKNEFEKLSYSFVLFSLFYIV